MRPQGFPRPLRLRRRREFLRTQRSGEKHHMRHFLVFVAPQRRRTGDRAKVPAAGERPAGEVTSSKEAALLRSTRLGVTVTRKVGGAVQRNRIKRLVREVFRRNRTRFGDGMDMVWVAKRSATKVTYDDVLADFDALSRRLARRGFDERRPLRAAGPVNAGRQR